MITLTIMYIIGVVIAAAIGIKYSKDNIQEAKLSEAVAFIMILLLSWIGLILIIRTIYEDYKDKKIKDLFPRKIKNQKDKDILVRPSYKS